MHFSKKETLFLLCLIITFTKILGQEKIVLKKYLPALEKHFNISFAFIERNVNCEVVPLLLEKHNTASAIKSLEKQTKLKFELTAPSSYSIRPLKTSDKVSICGYVKNQFNKPELEVRISSSTDSIPILVNPNGFFKIDTINYGASIIIKGPHFLLRNIPVKEFLNPECLLVTVYSHQIDLKEVVIPNYLSEGFKQKEEKIVFKPNEFEVLAGLTTPDIMQAIQQVPGVLSPFESASRIFIRGGTPDQNLVRWNGITTYNQSHFFGLLSAFNPYVIDEVDFYKKNINSKYGGRVGSLIDIKTDSEVIDQFSGGAGTNLLHADAFAKIPLIANKLSITASGRRSFTDLWESPTYKPLSERVFQNSRIADNDQGTDDFFFYDATLSINAQPTLKDKIQLNALASKNELDFSNSTSNEFQKDELTTQSVGYSLKWLHNWNTNWNHEINAYNSRYLLDYSFLLDTESESNANVRTNFVNDTGLETFFQYKNKLQSVSLGIQYTNNKVRYAFETQESGFDIRLDNDSNELKTYSSFLTYELQKENNYKLSLGLRSTNYSISNQHFFEPRLYLEKKWNAFTINASYNRQTQAVTQIRESEFSTLSLENLVWRATDDEFEVIMADHYNIGASYKQRKWFFETELYYKEVENIVAFSSGFLNILNSSRSIGESRTFGSELFVKRRFKNFESWLSYTFLNQKNRFESLNNNRFFKSNITIDHTLKWVTLFRWKRWHTSTSWLIHSGKTITEGTFNKPEDGAPVEFDATELTSNSLPIYHRLDASLKYKFKQKTVKSPTYEVGFSVQNLYNFRTTINREFRITPGVDNQVLTFDYASLGITPNLSFRIHW